MTTTPRRRFSVRLGISNDVDDAPYEGVPDHLLRPLQRWVNELGSRSDYYVGRTVCLRLRIPVPDNRYPSAVLSQQKDMDLLDTVDEILAFLIEMKLHSRPEVSALAELLEDSGSAYCVSDAQDGLEVRVSPEVRESVRRAVSEAEAKPTAGSAAEHLATAWQTVYGLHPDPVRAYSEAIKAVECAAHAIVQPTNTKATLGSMLGEIRNARHRFTAAISTPSGDPIAPAEAMMRALWEGQTSRHGAQSGTVPETLEAARAGVHLAATLVQWFTSGAVVRTR